MSYSDTSPDDASRRPSINAPAFAVMEVLAYSPPTNTLPAPSVADDPITQNTEAASVPFVSRTALALAVVRAVPAIMTKVDAALPPPSSVSTPVRNRVVEDAYTPACSVAPPKSSPSPSGVADGASALRSPSAAVRADCAAAAASLLMSAAPVYVPGPKLTDVPGDSAMSPSTTVLPTFVMVLPAKTLTPHNATDPCVGAGVLDCAAAKASSHAAAATRARARGVVAAPRGDVTAE